jgi:hypothetical protein
VRKPKEKKRFKRPGVERKITLNGSFKEEDGRGPHSSGSGYVPAAGSFKHKNDWQSSIK